MLVCPASILNHFSTFLGTPSDSDSNPSRSRGRKFIVPEADRRAERAMLPYCCKTT
jgi:hypothetical protein